VRRYLVGEPQPGWSSVPWELWLEPILPSYPALSAAWIVAIGAFLHFAPTQRPGLIRATGIACLAFFAARVIVGRMLPPFTSAEIDPDFRFRIASIASLSLTLAIISQQRWFPAKAASHSRDDQPQPG